MKKFIYIILFFITLFLPFSCTESNSDSNDDKNKLQSDANHNPNSSHEYKLPNELKYVKEREGFSYDKFYPIGWSENGNFAYITEPADENSGLYLFEIHIIDIVNNKSIWTWKPEESEEGNLEQVWNDNYELFAQRLKEYGIVQINQAKLESNKISYKSNDYEIIMDTKIETDKDFGIDMMKGIKITMKSPQLGSKDFFEQRIDSRDYILSAYIPGLLIGPNNDRAIVICQKERVGADGPPNMVFFEIIGTNLITGFKK